MKSERVFFAVIFCVFLSLFSLPVFSQENPTLPVKIIEIKGNKRVDRNTILFKLETKEGEPFSIDKIRQDVKNLYKTGFFEDVKVDVEPFEGGVKVTYIVKERPMVGRILIEGNRHVKTEEIRKQLKTLPFSIYNEKIIKENVIKIKQLYQSKGYYAVKIKVKRIPKAGRVDLVYEIEEGKKAAIAKIDFIGNKHFSDRELKAQLVSKEKNLWNMAYAFISSFLGKPATYYYIEDLFKADLIKLREFYKDHGFLRVVIGEPEVKVDEKKGKIYIKVPIEEGPRYKVADIKILTGEDDPFKPEQLKNWLRLREGDWYSASAMRKDVTTLTDLYGSRGYVNADVRPLIDVDDEKKEVHIAYRIAKGEKWYVGRIEVFGNVKTKDKVIRREIPLAEGELMNTLALKTAKKRLTRLGYFSSVNIETKPAEDHYMNVYVHVEEQPTGSLMLGGGYASLESFGAMVQLSEKNLFGTGRSVTLNGEFTAKRVEYNLTFFDPYVFDRPISFSLRSFRRTYEYDTFDEDSFGLTFNFGKRIFNYYTTAYVGYDLRIVDISDVDDDAPDFIEDQEGKNVSSALLFSISQDTRNSTVFPTHGFVRRLSLEFAGLGGDFAYYKVVANWERFISLRKIIKDSVFHFRFRVGFINPLPWGNEDRPAYERFYVGGADTVRGFEYDEASPEEDGEAIGGTKEFIANFEYLFPLVGGLRGLVFFDTGAAFDNGQMISWGPMRQSVGVGLRVTTPFGPVKVDLGYKLDKRDDEKPFKLHFSVGTMF